MQTGKIEKECVHVINCLGKANIVTVSKILNHFKVNYSILHDADSPKVKRDNKYIVNSMWTINQKINNEIEIGKKRGLNIKTFLSVPNFEGEYFEGKTGSSKPFGAWRIFTEEGNEVVDRFAQIIHRIVGKENTCTVEYNSLVDLTRRVSSYVVEKGLHNEQLWIITEEDMKAAINE